MCLNLNWRLSPDELAFVLADADGAWLIGDGAFASPLRAAIATANGADGGARRVAGVVWLTDGPLPDAGDGVGSVGYEALLESAGAAGASSSRSCGSAAAW